MGHGEDGKASAGVWGAAAGGKNPRESRRDSQPSPAGSPSGSGGVGDTPVHRPHGRGFRGASGGPAELDIGTDAGSSVVITPQEAARRRAAAAQERREEALRRAERLPEGWIVDEWLPSIGLPQLAPSFTRARVRPPDLLRLDEGKLEREPRALDGRGSGDAVPVGSPTSVLSSTSAGGLGVSNPLHRRSILAGVRFLAQSGFDIEGQIAQMRHLRWNPVPRFPSRLEAWTNENCVDWLCSSLGIDPAKQPGRVNRLRQSGLHGGLLFRRRPFADSSGDILSAFGLSRDTARPALVARVVSSLEGLDSGGAAHAARLGAAA